MIPSLYITNARRRHSTTCALPGFLTTVSSWALLWDKYYAVRLIIYGCCVMSVPQAKRFFWSASRWFAGLTSWACWFLNFSGCSTSSNMATGHHCDSCTVVFTSRLRSVTVPLVLLPVPRPSACHQRLWMWFPWRWHPCGYVLLSVLDSPIPR